MFRQQTSGESHNKKEDNVGNVQILEKDSNKSKLRTRRSEE
jgi:hypothetical protein